MAKRSESKRVIKAKKRGKRLLLLAAIIVALWILTLLFAPNETEYEQAALAAIPDLQLPEYDKTDLVVHHPGYALLYDEEHEQARWVAYQLDRAELYGSFDREDDFRSDPDVPTESATLDDYRKSGYDRGHLIPAADLSWSKEAMSGSFYLSNMSPQEGEFNRGIWSQLEATVRNFADTEGSIYVATGPVLTDGPYKTIGKSKVSVPKYYYKVLLDYQEPQVKAIGFLLPNTGSKQDLQTYATSVDEIENKTGINFFPKLPDPQEELLESTFDTDSWDFSTFQASAEERKAFNAETENIPRKTEKPSKLYSFANTSLQTLLYVVKKETVNLIELFVPKATLKEILPILY